MCVLQKANKYKLYMIFLMLYKDGLSFLVTISSSVFRWLQPLPDDQFLSSNGASEKDKWTFGNSSIIQESEG